MQTQSKRYSVAIKYKNGMLSYLEYRQRKSWTLKTARKHLAECIAKQLAGHWREVAYCTIVEE